MEKLPPTVDLLIRELDRHYPLRNTRPGDDIKTIMYQAGRRDVVEHLLRLQQEETER